MGHFWINNAQIPIVIMSIAAGLRFMERLPKLFPPEVRSACELQMRERHLPEFVQSKEQDVARIDQELNRLAILSKDAVGVRIMNGVLEGGFPTQIPAGSNN